MLESDRRGLVTTYCRDGFRLGFLGTIDAKVTRFSTIQAEAFGDATRFLLLRDRTFGSGSFLTTGMRSSGNVGVRGVGIGFELLDATEGIPKSGSEIVVLGEGRFADTGGRFGMIIEWGRRRRTMGYGSGDPLRWHCLLLLLIDRM